MTDVAPEIKSDKSPEQLAQEALAKRQMEIQQQLQHMEAEAVRGKRALTIACLNMCNMAIGFIPNPTVDDQVIPKSKRNPQTRMVTLADLDKVSGIVERLAVSIGHLSATNQLGSPMGMMRPR